MGLLVKWISRIEEYIKKRHGNGSANVQRVYEMGEMETVLLWPFPQGEFIPSE